MILSCETAQITSNFFSKIIKRGKTVLFDLLRIFTEISYLTLEKEDRSRKCIAPVFSLLTCIEVGLKNWWSTEHVEQYCFPSKVLFQKYLTPICVTWHPESRNKCSIDTPQRGQFLLLHHESSSASVSRVGMSAQPIFYSLHRRVVCVWSKLCRPVQPVLKQARALWRRLVLSFCLWWHVYSSRLP